MMNVFLITVRNILRDSTRAMSTVFIIAVGLAALLIGGGFMLSTYDALQEIAKRTEGHVIVLNDDPLPLRGGVHQQLTLSNWKTIRDELWDDERVLRILPRARFEGLISHGNKSAAFFGTGVDPGEEFRVYGPFLRTTAVLDPWLSEQDMPDVVLGTQLAETLSATTGERLTLHVLRHNGQAAEVVVRLAGLFHSGTPEIDDHTLMVNLSTVSRLLGSEQISQLSIYLEQYEQATVIKQLLEARLEGVIVQTWDQRAELYDKVKAQYDRLFGVMGIIILIVVFLAIANTITLAMYQRRDEIATLSALGTRPVRIYVNFIFEACLLGVVATSLGMLIAYVTSSAINLADLMMPAPPGRSEGYPIYIYISWLHYLITSVVFIALVAFASFIATCKNTKVNIAKALS